jgi:secondary thiamine-phosphate synthase enzyme
MKQAAHRLTVSTARGQGFYECTEEVARWVASQSPRGAGLLTVFIQHTSASLLIQENADPDVVYDLDRFLSRIAPQDNRLYRHTMEGPDDMPAHIRAALTQTHLSIPVVDGRLALGTWQGIYVVEHRAAPHRRHLALHLLFD